MFIRQIGVAQWGRSSWFSENVVLLPRSGCLSAQLKMKMVIVMATIFWYEFIMKGSVFLDLLFFGIAFFAFFIRAGFCDIAILIPLLIIAVISESGLVVGINVSDFGAENAITFPDLF